MKVRKIMLMLLAVIILHACTRDKRKPGRAYVPDMAYTIPYNPYTSNPNFADSLTSQHPVEGTIKRGTFKNDSVNSIYYLYAHYSQDDTTDYNMAGSILFNPVPNTAEVLAEGERLYKINCQICHGDGSGNGHIVETDKFPAVPTSYFDPRLMVMAEGQMFHVLQYGRNMMGSYASQLDAEQRWTILRYVKSLQAEYAAAQEEEAAASEKAVVTTEADNS